MGAGAAQEVEGCHSAAGRLGSRSAEAAAVAVVEEAVEAAGSPLAGVAGRHLVEAADIPWAAAVGSQCKRAAGIEVAVVAEAAAAAVA